jgi:hypothetical protein
MAYEQSTPERNLIGRRQALCTFAGIATAVAGFGLLGVGTARAAELAHHELGHDLGGETVTAEEAVRRAEDQAAAKREMALVEALIPHDIDVGKWSVEKVHAPKFGAIAVVMRTPTGQPFQVDVLRRDSSVSGVAETEHFSVFIANSGDGSKSTEEWQARGAKVLAHHLRRTERSGSPLPVLLSFSERASRHPFGNYSVLG